MKHIGTTHRRQTISKREMPSSFVRPKKSPNSLDLASDSNTTRPRVMNDYTTNSQMTTSGIPGVTMDAVSYVQRALLPGQTNPEAAATFARMIESSLKSWFTQFNFFLHNLAQLRFSGDHNEGELLSFIPRTYTLVYKNLK